MSKEYKEVPAINGYTDMILKVAIELANKDLASMSAEDLGNFFFDRRVDEIMNNAVHGSYERWQERDRQLAARLGDEHRVEIISKPEGASGE